MNATAVNTIAKEITVSSKALMTGVDSSARLVPSDKKGIRFHLGDKVIEAHVDNVVSTEHCTVIGNADIKVMIDYGDNMCYLKFNWKCYYQNNP